MSDCWVSPTSPPAATSPTIGAPSCTTAELLAHPAVVGALRDGLARMNADAKARRCGSGASLLMADPPSVDGHEITDKGYINQRATLERRKALVDRLYAGGEGVIVIGEA